MDMKHCMYNVHHLNHVLFEGIWSFDAGIEVAYESHSDVAHCRVHLACVQKHNTTLYPYKLDVKNIMNYILEVGLFGCNTYGNSICMCGFN